MNPKYIGNDQHTTMLYFYQALEMENLSIKAKHRNDLGTLQVHMEGSSYPRDSCLSQARKVLTELPCLHKTHFRVTNRTLLVEILWNTSVMLPCFKEFQRIYKVRILIGMQGTASQKAPCAQWHNWKKANLFRFFHVLENCNTWANFFFFIYIYTHQEGEKHTKTVCHWKSVFIILHELSNIIIHWLAQFSVQQVERHRIFFFVRQILLSVILSNSWQYFILVES